MSHVHETPYPCPPPAMTIDWRDYVDTMFAEKEKALAAALNAQEKAVTAALSASDKAIAKAEANAEKWRENANEWRGAMSDRDRELPSRREVDTKFTAIEAQMKPLVDFVAAQQGRQEGIGLSTGLVYSAVMTVVAVISIVVAIVRP